MAPVDAGAGTTFFTTNHYEWGNFMKSLTLLLAAAILGGCTTAGPYITNISSDGNGGLNVEKCGAKLNAWTGTISNTDCTSQHIQLRR